MAKMYTTSKTNPITGMSTDNNPRQEARQEKRQVRRDERALNKSLNEGIKKQGGGLKQYYKGTPVDETSSTPKTKDWRDKAKPDRGGKKNMSIGGGKSKLKINRFEQKKQDTSCRKPH
jgi:hypothetical protein